MDDKLEKKLYDKFPTIFQQKDLPASQTCMCWGISTNDGWFDLIWTLCAAIDNHLKSCEDNRDYHIKAIAENNKYYIDKPVPEIIKPVSAGQVKEKFGGLRFYYSGGDDFVRGLVAMAEAMSYKICEACGNKGKCNDEGWLRTECAPCGKKRRAARSQGI